MVPLPTCVGWYLRLSSQPLPVVTLAHVNAAGPVQPGGSAVRSAGVMLNPLAGCASSVVKSILTVWLLPLITAATCPAGVCVATTLFCVVARYGISTDPNLSVPPPSLYA